MFVFHDGFTHPRMLQYILYILSPELFSNVIWLISASSHGLCTLLSLPNPFSQYGRIVLNNREIIFLMSE